MPKSSFVQQLLRGSNRHHPSIPGGTCDKLLPQLRLQGSGKSGWHALSATEKQLTHREKTSSDLLNVEERTQAKKGGSAIYLTKRFLMQLLKQSSHLSDTKKHYQSYSRIEETLNKCIATIKMGNLFWIFISNLSGNAQSWQDAAHHFLTTFSSSVLSTALEWNCSFLLCRLIPHLFIIYFADNFSRPVRAHFPLQKLNCVCPKLLMIQT